ncbi:MAG: sugar ABC transporter permease [Spirochaetaceae bacterium]|nr:MAG: sugar ABC transporter permease [Spirochaetaceae bacterium]
MKKNKTLVQKNTWWIILFTAPVFVLLLMFFVYPLISLTITSFMETAGFGSATFVGFGNFSRLFNNSVFRMSIRNNLIWAGSAAFLQVPLALLIALVLARQPAGWRFFRSAYFLPNVISLVALAMLWRAVYNPYYGILNGLLNLLGLDHLSRNWLGELETVLPALIISYQIYVGYFVIILYAGTLSISKSLYEAAEIDGANVFQQEIYISIPALRGFILSSVTLAVAFAFRQFETTFLMTAGGPANQSSVMALFMHRRMSAFQNGMASAVGILLVIIGIVVMKGLQVIFGMRSAAIEDAQQ